MAEVKNTKEAPIRVIAGTFPAACGDYAKKLRGSMEAAGRYARLYHGIC